MAAAPSTAPAPAPQQFLMTSRFSEETAAQNARFRERARIKCIYCSPSQIAQTVPEGAVLFVLELNITTNKIMGIGMLKNAPKTGASKPNVYEKGNYNRYVYVGSFRIERDEFTEEEEDFAKYLDQKCFKGKYHMKRGSGITKFPNVVCQQARETDGKNLLETVKEMFRRRLAAAAAQPPRSQTAS